MMLLCFPSGRVVSVESFKYSRSPPTNFQSREDKHRKCYEWQGVGDPTSLPGRINCDHYQTSLARYEGNVLAVGSTEDKCSEIYDFATKNWIKAPNYKFQDGSLAHNGFCQYSTVSTPTSAIFFGGLYSLGLVYCGSDSCQVCYS